MKKQVCFFIISFWANFVVASLDTFVKQENVKAIQKFIDDPSSKLSYQDSKGNSLLYDINK